MEQLTGTTYSTHLRRLGARPRAAAIALLALILGACVPPGGGPPPNPQVDLAITNLDQGQTLSGTVAVNAGGIGGAATDVTITLGTLSVDADANGTAILDTRAVADGDATLEASATVDGVDVSVGVDVTVDNSLAASGTVGPDGGALGSPGGSIAILPPGALDSPLDLSVEDTTQAEILADFGVDYAALGVTFLGALTVDAGPANGTGTARPIQVDLAGQTQFVLPGQDVIMFAVAPDADGDGVGELMFAANAVATEGGSVVTMPEPRAAIYGFGGQGALRQQQAGAARPGEIVTLQGRGFLPGGVLSNVATFEGGESLLFVPTLTDPADFSSTMEVELAVPALAPGEHTLRFANLTTGFESGAIALEIDPATGGDQAVWDAFVDQLAAAAQRLASGRPALAAQADALLSDLTGATSSTAHAMAASSGLVSAQNLAELEAISADGYTPDQRTLVARHALLLDAVAVSVAPLAQPAADLAGLLLLATPQPSAAEAALRTQQSSGGCGNGVGSDISFGTPTGMGSAPTGGCSNGSAGGSGSGSLRTQRAGSVGPVAGALVRLMIPGTAEKLTPITAITDEAGYFQIPFVPPGEPFELQAFHPSSGEIFTAKGFSGAAGELISSQIVFSGDVVVEPGSPVASFTASPISGPFPDPYAFAFDASASSDDGTIVEYSWNFGDGETRTGPDAQVEHVYAASDSFTVTLFVTDDEGKVGSAQTTVEAVVPFPFEAGPAELVSVLSDGTQGDDDAQRPDVSDDGRFVVFTSRATNLAATPPVDFRDAFFRDMTTGELVRVNEAADGTPGNDRPNDGLVVGGDGSLVAFASAADNLVPNDTNGVSDIFLKDPASGAIVTSRPPGQGGDLIRPDLDGDGSIVVYDNTSFVFVEDRDQGTFTSFQGVRPRVTPDGRFVLFERLNRVMVRDLQTGDEVVASAAADGTLSSGFSPTISSDGRYVAFVSTASNLIPGVDPAPECCLVYVKDLQTDAISLASSDVLGNPADRGLGSEEPSISGDGRYLVFSSGARNLVPERFLQRFNNSPTVYVKDLASGWVAHVPTTFDGSLYDDTSDEARLSEDGRYIVFTSRASNLVAGDANNRDDIFRVENPLWEPPTP